MFNEDFHWSAFEFTTVDILQPVRWYRILEKNHILAVTGYSSHSGYILLIFFAFPYLTSVPPVMLSLACLQV